jgi:succinate dehydrogenase/fumarate reductase flavoprotein subunit
MSETFVIVGAGLAGGGAAVAANRGRDLRRSMWLIKAQHPIDPAKLWDPDGDLRGH